MRPFPSSRIWLVLILTLTGAVGALPGVALHVRGQTPAAVLPAAAANNADEDAPVAVPPATDLAMERYRSGNVLWIVDQIWSLLIPALFLFTGFSARLQRWATRIGRRWFFIVGLYAVVFIGLNALVDLPLSYYEDFVREHAYGLSNQTLAKWLGDSIKSLAIGWVAAVLFLWIPYLLLRKSPRRWWLYTGLAAVPFILFSNFVAPIWIAPLFNTFEPMQDKALERRILTLADRAGIEDSRVFEVNKSVDTKTLNAYVAGFGGTKRIVLWDTIIARMNERELLVVMGHEMGHYVLGHVTQGILFSSVLVLITLFGAHRTMNGALARYRARWGFDRVSDIASLPLLLLVTNLFSLAISPIDMAYTRYQEHEADRFALEITRTNHSAATAFVKLQADALANPRPGWLYTLFRSSHPSIGDRIDFCNSYKPWKTGQPLEYGRYFKGS